MKIRLEHLTEKLVLKSIAALEPLIPREYWSARTIFVAIAGWHHRPQEANFPQHSGVLAKSLKDTPVFEKEQLGLRFFKRKLFQIFLNFKVLNVLSHVFFQSAATISLSSPHFATFMTSWAQVDVMVWEL